LQEKDKEIIARAFAVTIPITQYKDVNAWKKDFLKALNNLKKNANKGKKKKK